MIFITFFQTFPSSSSRSVPLASQDTLPPRPRPPPRPDCPDLVHGFTFLQRLSVLLSLLDQASASLATERMNLQVFFEFLVENISRPGT